jgi:uncharacterized membrane protein
MTKGRLEAFSDGVIAVAITLLVLDLHVDAGSEESLWHQIRHEWPSFAAYLISFFVIGVIWVNHHALFALMTRVDRVTLFYNLLLLFWVSTIPFTTSALADFTDTGSSSDERIAVLLYGISSEGMAVSFFLILRHMLRNNLLPRPVPVSDQRRVLWRFAAGIAAYPVVTVVGLFSIPAMWILYSGTIVYYVLDQTPLVPNEPDAEGDTTDHADGADQDGARARTTVAEPAEPPQ